MDVQDIERLAAGFHKQLEALDAQTSEGQAERSKLVVAIVRSERLSAILEELFKAE